MVIHLILNILFTIGGLNFRGTMSKHGNYLVIGYYKKYKSEYINIKNTKIVIYRHIIYNYYY